MRFTPLPLAGAWLVEPERRGDARGSFARLWCEDEFREHGLPTDLRQINESVTVEPGTLRGLHYQLDPYGETKLVRCTAGRVFDVIVDMRDDSPTRRQWYGIELDGGSGRQLFVPTGMAHGYLVLEGPAVLTYLMGSRYRPEAATGVRWDDPGIGIDWPLSGQPTLSARDASWSKILID